MGDDARHLLEDKDDDEAHPNLKSYRHMGMGMRAPQFLRLSHHRWIPAANTLLSVSLAVVAIGYLWRLPNCIYRPHGPSSCINSIHFDSSACLAALEQAAHVKGTSSDTLAGWSYDRDMDEKNYSLTDQQCDAAFPGLFVDADTAAERLRAKGDNGRVTRKLLDEQEWRMGTVRGMIYDQEVRVQYHLAAHDWY